MSRQHFQGLATAGRVHVLLQLADCEGSTLFFNVRGVPAWYPAQSQQQRCMRDPQASRSAWQLLPGCCTEGS